MKEMKIMLNSMNEVKEFVGFTMRHKGDMTLSNDKYKVDAKSIMGVFSLNLSVPVTLTVEGTMPLDVSEGIHKFVV